MLKRVLDHGCDACGMTLAEVLVAVVVLSVGLMGLASIIPLSAYAVHQGRALSSATFLAEERLEEVRNAAWTAQSEIDCLGVSAGGPPQSTACTRTHPPCSVTTPCVTFPDENPVAGHPAYTRNVRVSGCADDAARCGGVMTDDQRLVRVTVTYRAIRGIGGPATDTSKSAVLDMIVAKRR